MNVFTFTSISVNLMHPCLIRVCFFWPQIFEWLCSKWQEFISLTCYDRWSNACRAVAGTSLCRYLNCACLSTCHVSDVTSCFIGTAAVRLSIRAFHCHRKGQSSIAARPRHTCCVAATVHCGLNIQWRAWGWREEKIRQFNNTRHMLEHKSLNNTCLTVSGN